MRILQAPHCLCRDGRHRRLKRFAAILLALGFASVAGAQSLPRGWSEHFPAGYRHDASNLVFGSKLARFELAMPPEVSDADGASAVSYMGSTVNKLTIYVLPANRLPAPADEGEFFSAIAGILQMLRQIEPASVGTFTLPEEGRENEGRVATFRFESQGQILGTLVIVVGARAHILKLRATYPSADEQKALVHVGESMSELLGQDIELVTKPAQ